MTVIMSNKVDDTADWDDQMLRPCTVSSNKRDESFYAYPIPGGVLATYVQKCRDAVTSLWVTWSSPYQDLYGDQYPGSGFDAGTYRIVSITHDDGTT